MRFKVSREELLTKVLNNVYAGTYTITGILKSTDSNWIEAQIKGAIAEAAKTAIQTMLENQYTDEDFEQDINLR